MKRIILFLITGVMCMSLFSCGKKYNVDYCGEQDFFKGAKSSYAAGATVKLVYDYIATDTDYSFYLDDEFFVPEWNSKKHAFIIKFKMPDHDVKLSVNAVNSMHTIMEPVKVMFIKTSDEEIPETGVQMWADDIDFGTLTLKIHNYTDETIEYGEEYKFQKMGEDGEFHDLEPMEEISWNTVANVLSPGEEQRIKINHNLWEELGKGTYRIIVGEYIAEFELGEEWTE